MTENEMTNQAAQTMPERPEFSVDEALRIADQNAEAYDKVASVSRTLAAEVRRLAALLQTAGEDASHERARLLVPVLKKSAEYWGNHHCASELKRAIEIIEDLLLAAAPAASGGDVCPKCSGPTDPDYGHMSPCAYPPAAPVSERARELLATEYDKIGLNGAATYIRSGQHGELDKAIIRALEQALTQQRGDGEEVDRDAWAEALELPEGYTVEEFLPGGWHYAWTRADGERMVSGATWNHPALAAIAAWQYAPATTPQPSADAVREDSARLDWIESQIREYGDGYTEPREAGWGIQWQQERPDHYWPGLRAWIDEERRRASGDELESLLSAASGEKGVG